MDISYYLGMISFVYHDTYGLPLDIAKKEIIKLFSVDWDKFELMYHFLKEWKKYS